MRKLTVFLFIQIFILSCSSEPTSSTNNDPKTGKVTDINGNVYQTVMIGEQWWIAENLRATHYKNGKAITELMDESEWENYSTGAFFNYGNDVNNVPIYGRLYNWYATVDSQGIAPTGWHVATDEEWKELEIFLGLTKDEADRILSRGTVEGGKLKEVGTEYWLSPNEGATNESHFSARPGGFSPFSGSQWIYRNAFFWTSSDSNSLEAWWRGVNYHSSGIGRSVFPKKWGLSVRCIKDN